MKRFILFIFIVVIFAACRDGWSWGRKHQFYQGCTEEALKKGDSPAVAKAFCDCVYGQMVKKYPNEEEALEHIDKLAEDTDLIRCRELEKQ